MINKVKMYQHRLYSTLALIISAALYLSCSHDHDHGKQHQEDLTIMFHAVSGETHLRCGEPFSLEEGTEPSFYLKDLRLFIHDVELKSTSENWTPFTFLDDDEWSDGTVTLLDYEDGTANCDEGGGLLMNHQIRGSLPHGDYQSIRFRVGVPPLLNHNDVTTAENPLNTSAMFWVWQRGYKFMRLEMIEDVDDVVKPWLFHLGSTGCESDAPTSPPDAPCKKMNSPWITIENFDLHTQHVALDLRGLLANIDIDLNTEETPSGCMSMPSEVVECETLFENFGLSFSTGDPIKCEEGCPAVFRAMSNEHDHGASDHHPHREGDHQGHGSH